MLSSSHLPDRFGGTNRKSRSIPPWLALFAPSVSMCALGVLTFVYIILLLQLLDVDGKVLDLTLFILGTLMLPPTCVAIQTYLMKPDFGKPEADTVETVNHWVSTGVLFALASIPVLIRINGGGANAWLFDAKVIIWIAFAIHSIILAVITIRERSNGPAILLPRAIQLRANQVPFFLLAFLLAAFALFLIDPLDPYLNLIVAFFFQPPFSSVPATIGFGTAVALSLICLFLVIALAWFETVMATRNARRLRMLQIVSLCVALGLTPIIFFDFSLDSDPLHYLTNLGPALHLRHGGRFMVDTFSQYGPGPVFMTLIGISLTKPDFGTANLVVQFHNLAFYALWIICVYRMSSLKLSAILLGLLSIACMLAAWGSGLGNLNAAPSIIGFRYLPVIMMVLSLSMLAPPKRNSIWTSLSAFVASLWSAEALIGALGIHIAFIGMVSLRDRNLSRATSDVFVSALPAGLALFALTIGTKLIVGVFPDYGIYLQILSAYNPLSPFWSIASDPLFFGWILMLMCSFLVLSDACLRMLRPLNGITPLSDSTLFYKFVPMIGLLLYQTTYFVGRSVNFLLVISLLAFMAIAIPAVLRIGISLLKARSAISFLILAPIAVALWALTFTFLALLRPGGPYDFIIQECRDHHRCTPVELAEHLRKRASARPGLDKVGSIHIDSWLDSENIVRDALIVIEQWGHTDEKVTVLLGFLRGWDIASDITLMYANKWHRWPRSFTVSDEVAPRLAAQIIDAPVHLQENELVIIRRDESMLGPIETGILKHIRAETNLCQLPFASLKIVAFRVKKSAACPAF